MDREISLKEQKKLRRRKILKTCVPIAVVSAGAIFALSSIAPSMDRSGLDFITADTGTVEMSADASGKVVPAYEMTITSPVSTKILEIYCHEGDAVERGQSLMKLDLAGEDRAAESRQSENDEELRHPPDNTCKPHFSHQS